MTSVSYQLSALKLINEVKGIFRGLDAIIIVFKKINCNS